MVRKFFIWLHRWVGLLMVVFLVIEGVTGSMLAFRGPLTQFFDPGLYSQPSTPSAKQLDLSTLIEIAEQREPSAKFHWFLPLDDIVALDGVALIAMTPRHTAVAGDESHRDLFYLALDPWTGREIRRMDSGLYSNGILSNVMPFVYDFHKTLALGEVGVWILCITALLWTVDCFTGVYLTLPRALKKFWQHWKPAWLIKWRAHWPRINYDIHRSNSLWLWIALLIFAWSSVELLDKLGVFDNVMKVALGPEEIGAKPPPPTPGEPMGWQRAEARGRVLMSEIAAREGFTVGAANGLWYDDENRNYSYRVITSRVFPQDRELYITFNGVTGELQSTTGTTSGNANFIVSTLLVSFHMIGDPFDYTIFRWFVVLVGIALAAISITGVVIWVKKGMQLGIGTRRQV